MAHKREIQNIMSPATEDGLLELSAEPDGSVSFEILLLDCSKMCLLEPQDVQQALLPFLARFFHAFIFWDLSLSVGVLLDKFWKIGNFSKGCFTSRRCCGDYARSHIVFNWLGNGN